MTSRTLRVLVLEDNPDHAELVENALHAPDENFHVEVTHSVAAFEDAIRRSQSSSSKRSLSPFDAYILDYFLGEENGPAIMERLRSRGDNTPVILISGMGDKQTELESMRKGAAEFLVKSKDSLLVLPLAVKRAIIQQTPATGGFLDQLRKLFRFA